MEPIALNRSISSFNTDLPIQDRQVEAIVNRYWKIFIESKPSAQFQVLNSSREAVADSDNKQKLKLLTKAEIFSLIARKNANPFEHPEPNPAISPLSRLDIEAYAANYQAKATQQMNDLFLLSKYFSILCPNNPDGFAQLLKDCWAKIADLKEKMPDFRYPTEWASVEKELNSMDAMINIFASELHRLGPSLEDYEAIRYLRRSPNHRDQILGNLDRMIEDAILMKELDLFENCPENHKIKLSADGTLYTKTSKKTLKERTHTTRYKKEYRTIEDFFKKLEDRCDSIMSEQLARTIQDSISILLNNEFKGKPRPRWLTNVVQYEDNKARLIEMTNRINNKIALQNAEAQFSALSDAFHTAEDLVLEITGNSVSDFDAKGQLISEPTKDKKTVESLMQSEGSGAGLTFAASMKSIDKLLQSSLPKIFNLKSKNLDANDQMTIMRLNSALPPQIDNFMPAFTNFLRGALTTILHNKYPELATEESANVSSAFKTHLKRRAVYTDAVVQMFEENAQIEKLIKDFKNTFDCSKVRASNAEALKLERDALALNLLTYFQDNQEYL